MLISGHYVHFGLLKRHISGPHKREVLGVETQYEGIVADPNHEDPVEEVASDVEKGSFSKEQRLSDAAVELNEWGPATDFHPMQTRTGTALHEGRPWRPFEQYADYSSSDEQSIGGEVHPDIRFPQKENAEEIFMKNFLMDSEKEKQGIEGLAVPLDEELHPNFAADPEDRIRVPTPDDRHVSDFDDPFDSILRRQLPRQTHYPHSDD